MARDAGGGRETNPMVLPVYGPVPAPGRTSRRLASSLAVAWFLGAVRRSGGLPRAGRPAGVRTSRLRRWGLRKRGVRTATAGAVDELTIADTPVLEARVCPRSGTAFGGRITPEVTATCPHCASRVALLASPDGGPGGVYADHDHLEWSDRHDRTR